MDYTCRSNQIFPATDLASLQHQSREDCKGVDWRAEIPEQNPTVEAGITKAIVGGIALRRKKEGRRDSVGGGGGAPRQSVCD